MQLEYLQINLQMCSMRRFVFNAKFRLDCTTVRPIIAFVFNVVGPQKKEPDGSVMHVTLAKVSKTDESTNEKSFN
jgi:hypothetical protein